MNEITLTIDGKPVTARPGQTILEVIREHRLADIPTLCHEPKLPPYGACYLCVVEVEGVAKLIPSCSSPAADKMVVRTDNARIREARKTALELLLSNHYADCLAPCQQTCPAGVDVQGYIALIAMGKPREAVRLIKETNPCRWSAAASACASARWPAAATASTSAWASTTSSASPPTSTSRTRGCRSRPRPTATRSPSSAAAPPG